MHSAGQASSTHWTVREGLTGEGPWALSHPCPQGAHSWQARLIPELKNPLKGTALHVRCFVIAPIDFDKSVEAQGGYVPLLWL